jgi:hypothetical protein
MPLDPNIALQVRPFQMESPVNAMSQMYQLQGAQQANQLNSMKMAEFERARVEEEGLRNFLAGADIKSPQTRAELTTRFGKTGLGYAKALAEQEAAALEQKVKQLDYTTKITDAAASIYGTVKDEASWQAAKRKLTALGGDPKALPETYDPNFVNQEKMAATKVKDQLELYSPKPMQIKKADGSIIFLDQNPNSPTFGKEVLPGQATGMTPYEKGNLAVKQSQLGVSQGQLGVSQGQLRLAQENATKPVFNAAAGGFIAPPTKENPQGKFIPATDIQTAKDQQAAVKALQSAGYDPKTGEDNISKLIAKSTSGGLEAGTSAALAFFGTSTEGRKAISALEGTANQIATDLAGGKLGAGISNTDRDFIVGALGDVANPMKTSDERLAGWSAAKDRMMRVGLIPAPKTGTSAPAAGGVDLSNPLLKK